MSHRNGELNEMKKDKFCVTTRGRTNILFERDFAMSIVFPVIWTWDSANSSVAGKKRYINTIK